MNIGPMCEVLAAQLPESLGGLVKLAALIVNDDWFGIFKIGGTLILLSAFVGICLGLSDLCRQTVLAWGSTGTQRKTLKHRKPKAAKVPCQKSSNVRGRKRKTKARQTGIRQGRSHDESMRRCP